MGSVLVVVLLLLVQAPKTVHGLTGVRQMNDALDDAGRSYQKAADSLAISNDFVAAAVQLVPAHSTYEVVPPPAAAVAAGKVPQITAESVGQFFRSILLPSLPTDPAHAAYVLCYRCAPIPAHVTWLWENAEGDRVGRRHGVK